MSTELDQIRLKDVINAVDPNIIGALLNHRYYGALFDGASVQEAEEAVFPQEELENFNKESMQIIEAMQVIFMQKFRIFNDKIVNEVRPTANTIEDFIKSLHNRTLDCITRGLSQQQMKKFNEFKELGCSPLQAYVEVETIQNVRDSNDEDIQMYFGIACLKGLLPTKAMAWALTMKYSNPEQL